MTLLQTLILAITQGITELFPISSVAHAVLTPHFLHWNLSPTFLKEHFLPVVVLLHVGTALALLVFFGRDWIEFLKSMMGGMADHTTARKVLIRIIIGTIPAALIGLVLEKQLVALFSSARSAGFFLIVNGFILFLGEKVRRRVTMVTDPRTTGLGDVASSSASVDYPVQHGGRIEDLGYVDALLVGLAQSLALIPGFSRSGASIVAGFWAGLSHGEAARFSMLLATPIIAGAGILEVPKLLHQSASAVLMPAIIGGVVAGIVAFLSVWALMTWFRKHEFNAMLPFAVYCWVVGALALFL